MPRRIASYLLGLFVCAELVYLPLSNVLQRVPRQVPPRPGMAGRGPRARRDVPAHAAGLRPLEARSGPGRGGREGSNRRRTRVPAAEAGRAAAGPGRAAAGPLVAGPADGGGRL